MARRRRVTKPRKPAAEEKFVPVPGCQRHDGWTPEAQIAFIEALAQSGCVAEACRAVGKSRQAAYRLRTDPRAASFRMAWERALGVAIRRITDNAYSRALNGVVTPIFYHGEQIGERVRHDERLVMFLLRCRDATYYGRGRDRETPAPDLDTAAQDLAIALDAVEEDALDAAMKLEEEDAWQAERARQEQALRDAKDAEKLRRAERARAASDAAASDAEHPGPGKAPISGGT